MSLSGLELVITFEDMVELRSMEDEIKLQLLLPLPTGVIEFEIVPTRYQELDKAKTGNIILRPYHKYEWARPDIIYGFY